MLREVGRDVDRLLRGGYTQQKDLKEGRLDIPVRRLVLAGLLLGAVYGLFMGLYAALRGGEGSVAQLLATTAKVPLLFLLTLAVTFPSLYVISTLAGSSLRAADTVRLVLAAVIVNLALLSSLGPITGFFTLSTESYSFMVVLNVLFFTVAGAVGLTFLARALEGLFASSGKSDSGAASGDAVPTDEESSGSSEQDGPAPRPFTMPPSPRRRGRSVFTLWLVVFAVVGAQMGWILRPFIGSPNAPFELFRTRESNFFEALFRHLGNLFS